MRWTAVTGCVLLGLATAGPASAFDYLTCFKPKDVTSPKTLPPTLPQTVPESSVSGGGDCTMVVRTPALTCLPTRRDAAPPDDPDASGFTCYKLKGCSDRPSPGSTGYSTGSDGFRFVRFQLGAIKLFCLPNDTP